MSSAKHAACRLRRRPGTPAWFSQHGMVGSLFLLSHRSAGFSPIRRIWNGLVTLVREVEATPWGSRLLGNAWPAYLFALPLGARIWALSRVSPMSESAAAWYDQAGVSLTGESAAAWHAQARLLQEIVTVAFLGLVVVLFAVRRRGVAGRRSTFGPGLVALLGTFLLNVVAYLPAADSVSTDALLMSSAVVVLGTLFTIWSLATLGRCFGLLPEARGLVLRGPYRLVRHPVYLGELISALGLLIARPHPLVIVVFGVFGVLQYWRTIYEERALGAAFPAAYPAYRQRVPRLVPGLRA